MRKTEEMIYRCPLFEGIEKKEFPVMLETLDSQLKNYRSRQIVIKEGHPVYRMGILLEGTLTISDVSFWGTLTPIEEIQPGMIFAEDLAQTRGAIADERIEAVTASIVLWVGLSEILKLDGSQPWHTIVVRNLMNQFARRSLLLQQRQKILVQRSTPAKIRCFLSRQFFHNSSPSFDIPYTRAEMAEYLAVDRSALSTEIARLARDGWFSSDHNHFELKEKGPGQK